MRPVPDLIFAIAFEGGGAWNETMYSDERFDQLLLEARSTVDFDRRKEMYCEMQRRLHDDGGHITLAFRDLLDAKAPNVRGIYRPSVRAARLLPVRQDGVDRQLKIIPAHS